MMRASVSSKMNSACSDLFISFAPPIGNTLANDSAKAEFEEVPDHCTVMLAFHKYENSNELEDVGGGEAELFGGEPTENYVPTDRQPQRVEPGFSCDVVTLDVNS